MKHLFALLNGLSHSNQFTAKWIPWNFAVQAFKWISISSNNTRKWIEKTRMEFNEGQRRREREGEKASKWNEIRNGNDKLQAKKNHRTLDLNFSLVVVVVVFLFLIIAASISCLPLCFTFNSVWLPNEYNMVDRFVRVSGFFPSLLWNIARITDEILSL